MNMSTFLDYCRKHNRLFCYGAGRYGRDIRVYLKEQGIDIEGFIVSNYENDVDKILGKPIISLSDFSRDVLNAEGEKSIGILLAVSSRYMNEMKFMLIEKGIKDYFYFNNELLDEIESKASFKEVFPTNQYINVLLYHRVVEPHEDYWNLAVSLSNFEEQIKWLSDNYPIIGFNYDWGNVKEPSFVITFDDGYKDNFYNALPILEKYNVPAFFFISTGNIGTQKLYWWDELGKIVSDDEDKRMTLYEKLKKMEPQERDNYLDEIKKYNVSDVCEMDYSMSMNELKMLAASPIVGIGAHTVTHSSLMHERIDLQFWEIAESINYLRMNLKKEISSFSYPLGYYSKETLTILRDLGIKKAATVSGGLAGTGNSLLIPRNVVRNWNVDEFQLFVKRCFCIYAEEKK